VVAPQDLSQPMNFQGGEKCEAQVGLDRRKNDAHVENDPEDESNRPYCKRCKRAQEQCAHDQAEQGSRNIQQSIHTARQSDASTMIE
jgi:hypothetical protein